MKKDEIDGVDVYRRKRGVVAFERRARRVPRQLGRSDHETWVYQSVIVDPCISHSICNTQAHREERMGSP